MLVRTIEAQTAESVASAKAFNEQERQKHGLYVDSDNQVQMRNSHEDRLAQLAILEDQGVLRRLIARYGAERIQTWTRNLASVQSTSAETAARIQNALVLAIDDDAQGEEQP